MKFFKSLGGQVFTLMITAVLSTVIVLGLSFFYLTNSIIRRNLEQVLFEVVKNYSLELDNLLGNALKNSLRIANDPKIQAILRSDIPVTLPAIYSQELELDNQLSFIQNYVDNIFGFYVIGANGLQFKSNFSSPIYRNWKDFEWYRSIIENSEPVWFPPHEGSFTVNTIGQPLITLGLRIVDKSTGTILGVILTDIEVATLRRILGSGLGNSGSLSLFDGTGFEIASSGMVIAPDHMPLVYSTTLEYTNWSLVGRFHSYAVRASVMAMIQPVFILIPLLTLVVLITAKTFVNRITTPLRELAKLMSLVQTGNFSVVMDTASNDEIGSLSTNFNIMVSQINTLMKDLNEEHEKLLISELKTLEAQINPHFLYNTLESIIWLARNNENEDVVRLVYALTNLLRIGLNKGRTLVTIEEEIEHIRHYLVIQKVRYADEFESMISIPDCILQNKTLKLVLQPLVENAIAHGIQKNEKSGIVSIRADCTENEVRFMVSDSGPGLSEEECEKVRKYLHAEEETHLGFGLRNVNERIKLYFGDRYGISFRSAAGEGTEVTVLIPRI